MPYADADRQREYYAEYGRKNRERINERRRGEKRNRPELWVIWRGIKMRCYNPNASGYEFYGGRGIVMCEAWRTSYEAFASDAGKRPSPQHTIDRIDNDGNYEPGNIRWATPKEQAQNRRVRCASD